MHKSIDRRSSVELLEPRQLFAAGEVNLTFQQGVNGYLGTQDTYVIANNPDVSFGNATSNFVEAQAGQDSQSLVRFDSLFGPSASQIPAGATIIAATLTVYTGSSSGDESNTSASIHRMLNDWSESSTWNSMVNGISRDGAEASSIPDSTITPSSVGTPVSFNVTESVQAWVDDPSGNHGWAVIGNGSNLWKWTSSEKSDIARRPVLTVTYVPSGVPVNHAPIVSAGNDAEITLPSSLSLNGTVTDDGLPEGPANLNALWNEVSGPGVVTFGDTGSIDTTATFSSPGVYVLRLTASDGELSASDEVTIVVNPVPTASDTIDPMQIATDTGEKPQSKVWENRGRWWGVFAVSSGTWVHRLDGDHWTPVLKINSTQTTKADVKVVGDVAHVLMYTGRSSKLASVEYVSGGAGSYKLWTVRKALASVALTSGVETATLDIDGDGRMWVASEGTSTIEVRHSVYPYSSWSAPITLATGVSSDDIAVIETMADGSVGVLWSNQNTKRFGFRRHLPGTSPTSWTADEVPASQSALNKNMGMADDHLSLAAASDGTLYAAVKTGYDATGYPAIALLIRRPNGTWDNLYTVDTTGTRGIVVLNEAENSLMIAYSFTGGSGSGDIVYKKTSLSNISFGPRTTIMRGSLNNVSSAKSPVTDDVLFVAGDTNNVLNGIRMEWPGSSGVQSLAANFSQSSNQISLFDSSSEEDEDTLGDILIA